jgi:hypothetical protein
VSIRARAGGDQGASTIDRFIELAEDEIRTKGRADIRGRESTLEPEGQR